MKGLVPKLKRSSPLLLTILGAAGVVGTAYLAVRGYKHAESIRLVELHKRNDEGMENATPGEMVEIKLLTREEEFKLTWKCYIPAASVGLATILCIFGANGLNRHQQASIASAYALLDQAYKEYRKKAKELYGEQADISIRQKMMDDPKDLEEPSDGRILFYDEASGRYFERTMLEVLDAEYQLNRAFITEGQVKLNDFYDLLALPKTKLGATVGWSIDSAVAFFGYQWIDFEHDLVKMEDGLECYILHMEFAPSPDF